MRGKTPRTARKRNVEDDRVVSSARRPVWDGIASSRSEKLTMKQPLSEIFSSSHKQVENKAVSPSPFIHRVISKTAAPAAVAPPRLKEAEVPSQPQYPDLSQNLNSFQKYNTDSGYHGMEDEEVDDDDDDEMVLPDTQPEPETATQPFEVDEPARSNSRPELSASQRTTEDSFVSAQENVRARGETIEPMNLDPTPTQERTARPVNAAHKESGSEIDTTPKVAPQSKIKHQTEASTSRQARQEKPMAQEKPKEQDQEDVISSVKNNNPMASHQPKEQEESQPQDDEMEIEDTTKDDTILDDNFDDIGSPSDGSTPDRLPVRKSSLSFASLPAREPLTKKSMGGARISRTSHIDLAKLSHKRNSNFLGVHSSGHRSGQPSSEDNVSDAAMDIDNEKKPEDDVDMDQASKLHNKKSTQSLHDRISMLGKPQTRPNKSIPSAAGLSAGQIAYPELPAAKTGPKLDSSNEKTRKTPVPKTDTAGDDDWIKALDSPQRPNLTKSKTTDVMEHLLEPEKPQSSSQKINPALKQKPSEEPERPKSSASIFSSPRPRGHQQSASTSILGSTTPVGSPRRFEGPLSASKIRLQSIMKSAKGLFTSTGSPSRIESSSPVAHRVQTQERMSVDINESGDVQMSEPPHISSPPARQEGRRTRSSTEKEEKRQRKEQEDRQREAETHQEEASLERAKEQEKQRTAQLKAAQDKSSVEPDERIAQKPSQPQRQQSREPESKYGIPQPKQADRRPKPPAREAVQKPEPRPVSIRVGSTMSSRQIPVATSVSSSFNEGNAPAPAPASKQASLKKKGSNQSLQTASSTNSLKSSTSSQTQAQRKAQLASERKREQDRKRAAQQQHEESRRQEAQSRAESRAEADRGRRELSAQEESNKAAIERRRQENARRQHGRTGSQQIVNEVFHRFSTVVEDCTNHIQAPVLQHEKSALQSSQKSDLGGTRPQSRAGPAQNYGRINPPAPNPARPAKRPMNEEASNRPPVKKISNVHSVIGDKWGKGEDEQQHQYQHQPSRPSVRPPMGPPKRVSNMRQVCFEQSRSRSLPSNPAPSSAAASEYKSA